MNLQGNYIPLRALRSYFNGLIIHTVYCAI